MILKFQVFRHGDRAPDKGSEMFPKDPHNNKDFLPAGYGGLTDVSLIIFLLLPVIC